jgi:hypothetical protein
LIGERILVDIILTVGIVDHMTTLFPYVEPPKKLLKVIGEPDEGSRCYYAEGSEQEAGAWFDAISEHFRCVSPGGVSMFAPVTRAAVHKRLKEGRLTAFFFTVTEIKKTIFGQKRKVRETPYGLIPVDECKAWARELEDREKSIEEIRESVQDGDADFLLEVEKAKRVMRRYEYMKKKEKQGKQGK